MFSVENLFTSEVLVFALRMLAACICGGAIGFERTKRLKEAGIRTHCIIASAAALFMLISKYGFADLENAAGSFYAGVRGSDASRIASQVVSGISFLGAGVIFRNGNAVKGLTTAAGMWATAAVGMAIGGGMYVLGVVEAALIVIIQIIFHRFSIGNDAYTEGDIRIVATDSEGFREHFLEMLEDKQIQLLSLRMERHNNGEVVYNIALRTKHDLKAGRALRIFFDHPDIRSISM